MADVLTLADFGDNLNGFGQHSQQQVDELNKALGTGTGGEAYGEFADGSALRPESLEGTLKVVLATDKHVKLWKDIHKLPAYNTVEEYNVIDSYGGDASAFFVEGGLPEEEDANYIRKSGLVKFLGTTRVITHPMTLVRSAHGDVVARETQNGTMWLLQQLERSMFFGDSAVNGLAFDGILPQIVDHVGAQGEQIIDLKGKPLSEAMLEEASNVIIENYGSPSKLYLTPKAHADLSKIMFPRQRVGLPAPVNGMAGVPLNGFQSNGGTFAFETDVFLRPRGEAPQNGKEGAPASPVWADVDPLVADASTTGLGLPAGTYKYQVTAVSTKGESTPNVVKEVVVTGNGQVTIKFNRATSPVPAKSYRIYRDNGDGKVLFMAEIADSKTGTEMEYIDRNQDIPGTSTGFLLDLDGTQSMAFKQLAPLMKLPLARISASERFMILLYGMPLVYNPRRNVIFKNIGNYVE